MRRSCLLLALGLAACSDASAPPAPAPSAAVPDTAATAPPRADTVGTARPERSPPQPLRSDAPTPFDRAAMVFDTLEPQAPRVAIQPRPDPAPPAAPSPTPRPDPLPPPPPAQAPGSCDVRSTESFCFAYTGGGWTDRDARGHCGAAPDSGYRKAGCPEADAIATCRFVRDDAPDREILYTYYAPYALALAELACPGDFERIERD